jgi:hypothetical protein
VEAARASDNGEKFAAVTEEVSNLAKRSTDAVKDTTALINECVKKADNGTRVATKCKDSMENIVNNVKKASGLTKKITNASAEQSEGINQVNSAVQQMDQVTQQNAANAEETASASEELAAQAQTMKEQVNILAMQVGGKDSEDLHTHKSTHSDQKKAEQVKRVDNEASSQTPEQQVIREKTSLLKRFFNLRKRDHSTGSTGIKTHTADSSGNGSDENAEDNGNGIKDIPEKTYLDDNIIPVGENRIPEHDERFKDF